ncbi:MAG: amino acid permease [Ignavibacteriota bacterium]|jgi:APA family basic amino acid/polyamine antiporter|nr:MAG: amino acid permease [Chlorobiota bacterium]MBE7477518.1 amino acid permease [Ignavibacteriales bacterium]MBL1123967.1 amino acid permease [Ignavibacteriota bacterium]MEB2295312.1 amino acid permease [Ignavibacteria bacterium]NUM60665.1 amino acid permease [Ignavibacteriaceae bacterium]
MKKYFIKKPLHILLEEVHGENRLRRILGPVALTSLGVGAIIGTGIFVLTGVAAHDKAGAAVVLSFSVAGIACIFAALCYAEFASMVPVAGSAYTYAYATLGELFAWIIGWDLILEYAVASATVAHGWSHYFQDFIGIIGLHLPPELTKAPFDFDVATGQFVSTGSVVDITAIIIALIITIILVKGIKESSGFNTSMVIIKLAVVLLVIIVGAMYINSANWEPFAPFGYAGLSIFGHTIWGETGAGGVPVGVLAGAAMIFFAYIGFDSVSTHAEEAKRPHRDVPIGIITSLILCTVLYILVSGVITGMVPYDKIDIDAPVSNAFKQVGLEWAQFIVSLGAIAGITSVLLVMMLSQPRIFLAMARDGLLPENIFGAVHEKFRTPWKSTILTGIFVALLGGFLPLRILAELVNIGTLFAFVVVCAAVLIMRKTHPEAERPFKAPLFPFVPIMGIITCLILMFSLPEENWLRLFVWLAIGFAIYFLYSVKHSKLRKLNQNELKD